MDAKRCDLVFSFWETQAFELLVLASADLRTVYFAVPSN